MELCMYAVRLQALHRAPPQGSPPAADYVGLADSNGLVLGPNSVGEGVGSVAQNGIGAIVEQLERSDDAAATDLDEGGGEEFGWQLAGQLGTRILPRQGKKPEHLKFVGTMA